MIRQNEEYINFTNNLKLQLKQFDIQNKFSEIIFLCIGTNKVIGDMIGPMVGERLEKETKNLQKYLPKKMIVYGNMNNTINLKNVEQVLSFLSYQYQDPFLITIDTALGKEENIKQVFISNGEIEIGKALNNGIKYQSHINIKGVVGKYHCQIQKNINTLKNINIKTIEEMSEMICNGIKDTVKKLTE